MPHPDDMTLADLCEDQQRELEAVQLRNVAALVTTLNEENVLLRSKVAELREGNERLTDGWKSANQDTLNIGLKSQAELDRLRHELAEAKSILQQMADQEFYAAVRMARQFLAKTAPPGKDE